MKLSDEVEKLETQLDYAEKEYRKLVMKNKELDALLQEYDKILKDTMPIQVYHCKQRGTTSIKFLSGNSVTVRLKKGEEDNLETAITYALVKHLFKPTIIRDLMKKCKEVDLNED